MTPTAPLDLSTPQRLHVVGVGGPGMSAIAIVLAEMGHRVSGSDLRERPVLERVRAAGVEVHVGHHRRYVSGCTAVTASTAVGSMTFAPAFAEAQLLPPYGNSTLPAGVRSRRTRPKFQSMISLPPRNHSSVHA